jgi:hypothetical protein
MKIGTEIVLDGSPWVLGCTTSFAFCCYVVIGLLGIIASPAEHPVYHVYTRCRKMFYDVLMVY